MPDKHKMTAEEEQKMKEEMKRMEYEPLLPVEKKLIGYSIGLGVVLLFVFIWLSKTFFNVNTQLEAPTAEVKQMSAPAPAAPAAPVPAVSAPAAPAAPAEQAAPAKP